MNNIFFFLRPDLVFIIIWSICLFIAYNFTYLNSGYININSPIFIFSIYLSIQYFFLFNLLNSFYGLKSYILFPKILINNNRPSKKIIYLSNFFIKIWFLIFFLTFLRNGNIPLFSTLFGNGEITYVDVIPTFSGLGSLARILGCSFLSIYLTREAIYLKKIILSKYLIRFIFLITSPLTLSLSRGEQILLLLLTIGSSVSFNNIKFTKKNFLKFTLFLIIIFPVIFTVFTFFAFFRANLNLGEFFSNSESYLLGIGIGSRLNSLKFLVEGPLGIINSGPILYLSSPLKNINLQMYSHPNFNLSLDFLTNFLPSIIRTSIVKIENVLLINESLNSSGYLAFYFRSFGIFGSLPFLFLIQFFSIFVYLKAKSGSLYFRLIYPTIFACNFLAFFYDYFSTLTILLYPIVIKIFFKRIKNSFE